MGKGVGATGNGGAGLRVRLDCLLEAIHVKDDFLLILSSFNFYKTLYGEIGMEQRRWTKKSVKSLSHQWLERSWEVVIDPSPAFDVQTRRNLDCCCTKRDY